MTEQGLSEFERKKLAKRDYNKQYHHTRGGLVARIYSQQRRNSRERGHQMPDYDLEELRAWVFSQTNFNSLFQSWADSDFQRMQTPSCDRLDDYKPYTLDNLRLVTWSENEARSHADRKRGVNNKLSKAVLQFTKSGEFIAEYHSANHAGRTAGVSQSDLSSCCRGIRKSAGGFVWVFAEGLRESDAA